MSKKRPVNPEDHVQLPDPRDVNRQIRLENERAKQEERKAKRGVGLFCDALVEARKRHANDPHAQIEYLFQQGTVPAGIGRHRFVGDGRLDAFRSVMHLIVRLIRERRCPVQNLGELGKAHVLACMRAWEEQGLTEGTIQGYLSVLRRFFCLVGKPNLLPTNNDLRDWLRDKGLTAGTIGREQVPEVAKGWRDAGVSPELFIETLRAQGELIVASIVEMSLNWGLRDQEGWFCRPHVSELEGNGNGLMLRRGTKGDRVRLVRWSKNPERAQRQREALERAKVLAALHPRRELSIPGLTAKQMKNYFKWVMRKNGATKKVMGVTAHGLRHQFACDLFLDLTGMPAPVLGLLPAEAYRNNAVLVQEAMKEISLQLGHERPSISGNYVGSVRKLDKGQIRRTNEALQQVAPAHAAFRDAPVSEAWLVGTYGRGGVPRPGEIMEIAVRPADLSNSPMTLPQLTEALRVLQAGIQQGVPSRVRVQPWVAREMPDDAAEIVFQRATTREECSREP